MFPSGPASLVMPCFQRCCCCVNIRTGGLMMGFMTLVMSIFSIVPMAISLSNRLYLSRVVVYMLGRYGRPTGDEQEDANQVSQIISSVDWILIVLIPFLSFSYLRVSSHLFSTDLIIFTASFLVNKSVTRRGFVNQNTLIMSLSRPHLSRWSSGGP